MSEFLKDLQDCKGNAVDASTLKGKLVALYFSVSPCSHFHPPPSLSRPLGDKTARPSLQKS
jgi:hypothetical protein